MDTMYFNILIVLLTWLICAGSTPPKKNGLDKEYRKATAGLRPEGRNLNEFDMADFAGISVQKLREIANSISIENLENINLETFKLLVNKIIEIKSYSIREAQKALETEKVLEVGSFSRPALDAGLEKEYSKAKSRLDVPDGRGFNEVEMAVYAGINVSELKEIANSISISIENLENIEVNTFKLLVNAVKKKRGKTITNPQEGLEASPYNTLDEDKVFKKRGVSIREPQSDLEAGPYNTPISDEEEVLEMAYSFAKIDHGVFGKGRGLNESQMAICAGISVPKLRVVASSIAIENLENINFKTFKLLVKAIKRFTKWEHQAELEGGPSNTPSLDEDKVIEKAYNIAKFDHGVLGRGRSLNESQMANHVGLSVPELKQIANSISIENLENINLETFKLLMKVIKRITIWEPQAELEAGPSNTPTLDEDEVLEMAYSFAKIDHGVLGKGRGLNESQMANRASISVPELRVIARSVAIENLDNISLRDFKLLAKKICEIKGVSIMDI